MSRDLWMEDPKAVKDAEKVYAFIGMYVISFQWFEDKMDQLFILGRGAKNSKETRDWLVRRTLSDKIKAFQKFAKDDDFFYPAPQDGWYDEFNSIMRDIDAERDRRNGLLHSYFIFDFLAVGQSVISNTIRKESGSAKIHNVELSAKNRDSILEELASLAYRFSMACVQLRNLAKDP